MRTLLPIAALVVIAAPGCIIRRESLSGGDLDANEDARGAAADARGDAGAPDAFGLDVFGRDAFAPDTSLDAGMDDAGLDAFVAPDPDAFVTPDPDAFVPTDPDAFVVPPDAFVVPPDAFVVPPDAFVVPPDAFVVPPDAFVAPDAPACVSRAETCNGRDDDCDGVPDDGVCRIGGTTCTAFTVADHVYQYCPVTRNRDGAAGACAGFPGYALVRIESNAENEAVRMRVMSTVWTQLNDRTVEGSFRFDDGSMASYFRWTMGEPNNMAGGPGEDCVTLYTSGTWNDARCWSTEDFVCERAIAP